MKFLLFIALVYVSYSLSLSELYDLSMKSFENNKDAVEEECYDIEHISNDTVMTLKRTKYCGTCYTSIYDTATMKYENNIT